MELPFAIVSVHCCGPYCVQGFETWNPGVVVELQYSTGVVRDAVGSSRGIAMWAGSSCSGTSRTRWPGWPAPGRLLRPSRPWRTESRLVKSRLLADDVMAVANPASSAVDGEAQHDDGQQHLDEGVTRLGETGPFLRCTPLPPRDGLPEEGRSPAHRSTPRNIASSPAPFMVTVSVCGVADAPCWASTMSEPVLFS